VVNQVIVVNLNIGRVKSGFCSGKLVLIGVNLNDSKSFERFESGKLLVKVICEI
jgi:hypothetical protein